MTPCQFAQGVFESGRRHRTLLNCESFAVFLFGVSGPRCWWRCHLTIIHVLAVEAQRAPGAPAPLTVTIHSESASVVELVVIVMVALLKPILCVVVRVITDVAVIVTRIVILLFKCASGKRLIVVNILQMLLVVLGVLLVVRH